MVLVTSFSAIAILAIGSALLGVAGCGEDGALPQGSEPVDLQPAEFTAEIDNPFWPMDVGSRWIYRERDAEGGEQRVVVTVTDRTKPIA
ncbi:MAG TPA: hypothetical protein VFT10_05335, partial [Solirubrobacterales bacterium]|nr:hypothetical protein [Solirubrobacterales bacterium]